MQRVLAVAAHPDDESFLFGGLLSAHAARGGRAGLLCLTDGQAGRTGGLCTRDELGAVRREELHRAVGRLGIQEFFTPGMSDGNLDKTDDAAGARLVEEYAARFGADVLLTFGPEGASGHPDHKACWRWACAAGVETVFAATFPAGLELPRGGVPLPVTHVVNVAEAAVHKREAFLEHRTQRDHQALFDRMLAAFDGREYYHRVRPAWVGAAPARGIAGTGGDTAARLDEE